jgi:hypothetical protein
MARLDLGFDLDKAGRPSAPGPAGTLEMISQAEAVQFRNASLRAVVAAENEAMQRFGRALFECIVKGEVDRESLPASVRDVLPTTAPGRGDQQR